MLAACRRTLIALRHCTGLGIRRNLIRSLSTSMMPTFIDKIQARKKIDRKMAKGGGAGVGEGVQAKRALTISP